MHKETAGYLSLHQSIAEKLKIKILVFDSSLMGCEFELCKEGIGVISGLRESTDSLEGGEECTESLRGFSSINYNFYSEI